MSLRTRRREIDRGRDYAGSPGPSSKKRSLMKYSLFTLEMLDGAYAVCRLAPGEAVPEWAWAGPFAAVSRTPDETSVVCRQEAVPAGVRAEPGWRCLRVAGPLDFAA